MDFCHALASQGVAFSFSLSVGSDFSSSLDAREKKQTTPAVAAEVLLKRKSDKEKHGRGGILRGALLYQIRSFLNIVQKGGEGGEGDQTHVKKICCKFCMI